MTEHENIKILISAYYDNELSDEERQIVSDHIIECAACRKAFQDYSQISSSLQEWPDESLSPDAENNMSQRIRELGEREGQKMKKTSTMQMLTTGGLIFVAVIAMVVTTQNLQRGLGGRLKDATRGPDLRGSIDLAARTDESSRMEAVSGEDAGVAGERLELAQLPKKEDALMYGVSTSTVRPDGKASLSYGQKTKKPREKLNEAEMSSGLQNQQVLYFGKVNTPDAHRTRAAGGTMSSSYEIAKTETKDLLELSQPKGQKSLNAKFAMTGTQDAEETQPFIQIFRGGRDLDKERQVVAKREVQPTTVRGLYDEAEGKAGLKVMPMTAPGYYGDSPEESRKYVGDINGTPVFPEQDYDDNISPYSFKSKPKVANTEQYDLIYENEFLDSIQNPLSTFSIDVDTASYSNMRRFINQGQLPPPDAVRIEEMVNYFVYDYPQPRGDKPFSVNTETTVCPWNNNHYLTMIGLQGKELTGKEMPSSNLVFLIDVSGSMSDQNKLPLLRDAFKMMVQQLRPEERVSIVTYAGNAGLVLDSTPGYEKERIMRAIDNLRSGGSTAGAQGISLAYQIAAQNYIPGGNNRVILATDGDFNVGVSSDSELVRIIENKRNEGVFLTVLGFGTGNYKDAKMEKLADKGNGNYYYLDNIKEAEKVLVHELGSLLFSIAKDVKLQIEFNPSQVAAYRLIGYENRMLAKEDFNDDTKDAGELGAGHTVTALYEIIPVHAEETVKKVDPLKYLETKIRGSNDLMTVKLRYKKPEEEKSRLITQAVSAKVVEGRASMNMQFASSVAEFGLLLRNSRFKGSANYGLVLNRARASMGQDAWGYRREFIRLVEQASMMQLKY